MTGRYTEKLHGYDEGYAFYYLVRYDQPRTRRMVAWLYHNVWEKVTGKPLRNVERLGVRFHNRHCNGDCHEGYDRRVSKFVPLCAYTPYTIRQDLRCYDLTMKGRHNESTTKVEKSVWDRS